MQGLFTQISDILAQAGPNSGVDLHIERTGADLSVAVTMKAPDRSTVLHSFTVSGAPGRFDTDFADTVTGPLMPGAEERHIDNFSGSIDARMREKAEAKAAAPGAPVREARQARDPLMPPMRKGQVESPGEPMRIPPEQRGPLFEESWRNAVEAKHAGDFDLALQYFTTASLFADSDNRKARTEDQIRKCEEMLRTRTGKTV